MNKHIIIITGEKKVPITNFVNIISDMTPTNILTFSNCLVGCNIPCSRLEGCARKRILNSIYGANDKASLLVLLDDPNVAASIKEVFDATTIYIGDCAQPHKYDLIVDQINTLEDLKWDACRVLLWLIAKENLTGEAFKRAEHIILDGLK